MLITVLVHLDVFTRAQAAYEAVVDTAEQLLFLVCDADDRELGKAVQVVDDAGVFELVDLIEADDCPCLLPSSREPSIFSRVRHSSQGRNRVSLEGSRQCAQVPGHVRSH